MDVQICLHRIEFVSWSSTLGRGCGVHGVTEYQDSGMSTGQQRIESLGISDLAWLGEQTGARVGSGCAFHNPDPVTCFLSTACIWPEPTASAISSDQACPWCTFPPTTGPTSCHQRKSHLSTYSSSSLQQTPWCSWPYTAFPRRQTPLCRCMCFH